MRAVYFYIRICEQFGRVKFVLGSFMNIINKAIKGMGWPGGANELNCYTTKSVA